MLNLLCRYDAWLTRLGDRVNDWCFVHTARALGVPEDVIERSRRR